MYYTSTYTIALIGWLQMLEWPEQVCSDDPGITFLELYVSFRCTTGSMVPFNTANKSLKVQTYQAFESGALSKCIPYPLHQQLRVFEFSLAYVVKLFGEQAFPIKQKANVSSLIPIGFRTSRAGIRGRPKFPFQEQIVGDLANLGYSNLAYKSIDGFPMPKVDPLIPTLLQDDDLTRNPHTSYTKFKRLLKQFWALLSGWRCFTEVFDSAVAVCHALSRVVSFLVRSPRRSHERFKSSSSDQNPGCLLYIGDYTTQLHRDFNRPLPGSLWTNQYNGMS